MTDNWRPTETDSAIFFGNQKKRQAIEARRPVLRKASDLVGPGIAGAAVRVTNWNDTLALFNGYFSSLPGAQAAPNSVENFTGFTVMDTDIGGIQTLTGMASGAEYKRIFTRNPSDPSSVAFGLWQANAPMKFPNTDWARVSFLGQWTDFDPRYVQYKRHDGWLKMRGIMKSAGSIGGNAFYLPPGFRPESRVTYDQYFPCVSNNAFGGLAVNGADGFIQAAIGSPAWIDVSGMTYEIDH